MRKKTMRLRKKAGMKQHTFDIQVPSSVKELKAWAGGNDRVVKYCVAGAIISMQGFFRSALPESGEITDEIRKVILATKPCDILISPTKRGEKEKKNKEKVEKATKELVALRAKKTLSPVDRAKMELLESILG